jgi:hypothetical protein
MAEKAIASMSIGRILMKDLRVTLRAGVVALFAVSVMAGTAAAQQVPDLSGIWWIGKYNAQVEVIGGGGLPLTDKGKAEYGKIQAGLKDGSISDDARRFCVPDGPVRTIANPYPFEIVQAPPGQVTILYELNHQIRVVRMDKPLPKYEELVAYPAYNGYSVGRYEGDTLVIETGGFNEKTWLDATGAPHTDELVTVERVRKTSPTDLEWTITVKDPDYYTREWSARFTYKLRNDLRIEDYNCGEEHRDISHIPGVRRP